MSEKRREGGIERWSWRGREGAKKKDTENEKWRDIGIYKGEMERVFMFGGEIMRQRRRVGEKGGEKEK